MVERALNPSGEKKGEKKADKKAGAGTERRRAEPRAIQLQRTAGNRAVQRLAGGGGNGGGGGGRALDSPVRSFMESRFDADFGDVRVHTDDASARSAARLGARAYTTGRDVYFGSGEYEPQSREGRELLAHELTHVVQQDGEESAAPARSGIVPESDPSEREAESVARQVAAGGSSPVRVSGKSPGGVHRVSLTADDFKALAVQIHEASVARWGTDEEAVFVALQKLEKDKGAIKKLKDAYKLEYKRNLRADLVSEMSGSELRYALELLGETSSDPTERVAKAAPSTAAEFEKEAAKLHHAMKGGWTGWGTDEETIYATLVPFKRDQTKITQLKTTYKTEHKSDLEADLKSELSAEELAYALYLLNAPLPPGNVTEVAVTKAGTQDHKAKVEGGEVTVSTGLEIVAGGTTYKDSFAIKYEGGVASQSRWLQLLWSEVLVTKSGTTLRIAKSGLATSNGSMELTTDPSNPKYKVDSGSSSDPFYEAGFADNRTSTGTTIYDRPSEFTNLIKKQFDAGATKVVERDYFDTYLVRDYRAIYHVRIIVEWVYTSKTAVTRKTSFGSGSKVNGLPTAVRKQLIKEYPKFDYIY